MKLGVIEMAMTLNQCEGMESKLADLLLAPETASAKVKAHVADCGECEKKLGELRATMTLLDTWEAPEPSPYFMTRMNARLDEARQEPREGWLARLRARMLLGPQLHVRPVAAMALTVVLLLGAARIWAFQTGISLPRPNRDRQRWCRTCSCWTTTRSCWISWKPSRAMRTEIGLSGGRA